MNWFTASLYHALVMAWETFWALVMGFAVSAALQVFISKEQMARLFGRTSVHSMALATGFGAASSSCSYAAAAAARSAFKQGAALLPALAFMFASTNLVVELGAVLWLLMGWRFVAAEFFGAFVLVALLWLFAKLFFPKNLEREAREHAGEDSSDHDCHHGDSGRSPAPFRAMADAFVMDWQMLWKEIAIGFLIAGLLSATVPQTWWQGLFLTNGPVWLRLLENAMVGPLIAVASFVCSVGNIPLANLLWSSGISFGGVISFIYADLIIIPLILIYRKYYGGRAAAYITGVFYLSMTGAGILVDLFFTALGWLPKGPRPPSALMQMHFQWDYTSWLDIAAVILAGALLAVHLSAEGKRGNKGHHAHAHH